MTSKKETKNIALIGMIAAIYTVISLVLGAASFGPIQIRFAEVLVVLAILMKEGIYGVTIGCIITNVLGVAMGMNSLGMIDAVIGSLVTFVASILAYKLREIRYKGIPYLSLFMPVILNAIFIGLELTLILHGSFDLNIYFMHFGSVFIGQFIACMIAGGLLFLPIEKTVLNHL